LFIQNWALYLPMLKRNATSTTEFSKKQTATQLPQSKNIFAMCATQLPQSKNNFAMCATQLLQSKNNFAMCATQLPQSIFIVNLSAMQFPQLIFHTSKSATQLSQAKYNKSAIFNKKATYSNIESTNTQEHVFVSILNCCWTRWTSMKKNTTQQKPNIYNS